MTIAVVGDTLLDVDLTGTARRLSPDAGVPVVDVASTAVRAGGAGLVARMLADDGGEVVLVTALSDDQRSVQLRDALGGIRLSGGASNVPTPVKTRLSADGHAVARIDDNCVELAPPTITDAMVESIVNADAVLVADYGRGVAADPRLRAAIEDRTGDVPVIWDPHPRGAPPVPFVTAATPNLAEALAFAGLTGSGLRAASDAGAVLTRAWQCRSMVITLGAGGALLMAERMSELTAATDAATHRGQFVVPADRVGNVDPCGAGDRLAATLTRELLAGTTMTSAVEVAVQEASRFLANGGVSALGDGRPPVGIGGLRAEAITVADRIKRGGGTVVATGGCFDLLHAGHARTLSAARSLGDCLIVCVNSDRSVRQLKGADRPIVSEVDRVALLLSLECVDAVFLFDERTPEEALRQLRPDLWVKGGDYAVDDLPEAQLVNSWGGRTVTVPYHPAHSTSLLAAALARVS